VNLARIAAVAEVAQKISAAVRERLVPPVEQPTQPQERRQPDRHRERAAVALFAVILGAILGGSQF
jgi:hypothetical protein